MTDKLTVITEIRRRQIEECAFDLAERAAREPDYQRRCDLERAAIRAWNAARRMKASER